MKNTTHYFLIVIFLFISSTSFADKPVTQIQEAKKTSAAFIEAETYKAVERELVETLISEHHSQFITKAIKNNAKATMAKLSKALANMKGSERIKILKKLAGVSKKGLKTLSNMSQSSLKQYVHSFKNTKSLMTLRRIIGETGDKTGNLILKKVSEVDEILASGGKVSKKVLKKILDSARKLPPERAKACYDLVAKKMGSEWKQITKGTGATASFVGTVVDGVFVLNDAYNIYYIEDPEEKAIQATNKIIDYGSSTVAGMATGVAEGAAATTTLGSAAVTLLPGLVIALSANRVATLYSEIKGLERDKAKAKSAELEEKLQNGITIRRALLKTNQYIQAGDLEKAKKMFSNAEHFALSGVHKRFQNQKVVYKLLNNMKAALKKAKRIEEINKIINEARFPYNEAIHLYNANHQLLYAKTLAKQSLNILKSNVNQYPEIRSSKALVYIKQLIVKIDNQIANAAPLKITGISGPKQVSAGEYIHYTLFIEGGVPDYKPVGIDGYGTQNSVTLYWKAPLQTGKKHVRFTISDSLDNKATTDVNIEVRTKSSNKENVKIKAFTKFHYQDGQLIIDNEAHDLYPGSDDINFLVNINNPNYTYIWKVNGIKDTGQWKNKFHLRTAEDPQPKIGVIGIGVNTISVDVYDRNKNKLIGSDSWVIRVKNFPKEEYWDEKMCILPGDIEGFPEDLTPEECLNLVRKHNSQIKKK